MWNLKGEREREREPNIHHILRAHGNSQQSSALPKEQFTLQIGQARPGCALHFRLDALWTTLSMVPLEIRLRCFIWIMQHFNHCIYSLHPCFCIQLLSKNIIRHISLLHHCLGFSYSTLFKTHYRTGCCYSPVQILGELLEMAIGIFTQSTQAFAICSGQMTKLINCLMIFLPPKGDAEENPVRPEKNRFYCYICFINKNVFLFNCPCFSPLIDRKQARLRRSFFS